jgi:hypothetical protein
MTQKPSIHRLIILAISKRFGSAATLPLASAIYWAARRLFLGRNARAGGLSGFEPAIARELAAGVVANYSRKHDSAVAMLHGQLRGPHRAPAIPGDASAGHPDRESAERLIVEERRSLKIIPNAFGERPVLKLICGAFVRAADRRKSIKVTEFERRQASAVKKELDKEYEVQIDLNPKPPKAAARIRISSSSQT